MYKDTSVWRSWTIIGDVFALWCTIRRAAPFRDTLTSVTRDLGLQAWRKGKTCAPLIFTFASAELLAGSKHLHSNDIQGILYDLWSKWYLCQDSFACFKASKWLINIFVALTDCFSFLLNNIYWHTATFVSHSTEIKSRQDLMKYDWQRSLWIQSVIIIAEIHLDRPISVDIFLCKSQINSSGS